MKLLNFLRRFRWKYFKPHLRNGIPIWLSSREYAKKFNAKWFKVYERVSNNRPPPFYYGSLRVDFQNRLDPEIPEVGVLELSDAYIFGHEGWIFSKEGYLLPDHSWYVGHVNEISKLPKFIFKSNRLNGVCLSLASDNACVNYGHFLLDCISRLELFNKAGFKLSDVDHIFCPKPTSKEGQRLLDQLGIPASKCIWADGNRDMMHVETLIVPTFPGTRRNYPKWVPAFLQREFLPSPLPSPSRRLYISRVGCSRNAVNEEAVTSILMQNGFEIYDHKQHTNQPYDFAEAKVVIGPHGAGLANIAFCQPGTKVLELIPTDHVYPYFYTLSDAAGLAYSCLICRSTNERSPVATGPSPYNFYVNEDELKNALTRIISEV